MKPAKKPLHGSPTKSEKVAGATIEQQSTKTILSPAPAMSLDVVVYDSAAMKSEISSQSPTMALTTLKFSLQADPYEINQQVTLDYIDRFFTVMDKQVSAAIPKTPFLEWVKTCRHKSTSDKMMIYAVLALGSVFVEDSTSDSYISVLSTTVQEGITQCGDNLTFQLATTYLLSTLLAISQGEYNRALNFCGSAMRTIYGLQFNTEAGIRTTSRSGAWESLLDTQTLVECRRSLTWSAFIIECLNGCYTTPFLTAAWSDYDLCLPRTEKPFPTRESLDEESLGPVKEPDINPTTANASADLKAFGYLIQIATMFHEVANFSYHQRYRSALTEMKPSQSFHSEIERCLDIWKKSLHHSQEQSENKIPFLRLRILYHYTSLHLHRYVRHAALDPVDIAVHVKATFSHAYQMLELVHYLNSDEKTKSSRSDFKITSPCIEHAITTGLDVLTAARRFSDFENTEKVMSLISSGLEVLDDLARFSFSARQQRDQVKQRWTAMLKLLTGRSWDQRKAFYFKNPILLRYGMDQDIVYGISRTQYFQALDSGEGMTADDFYEVYEDP